MIDKLYKAMQAGWTKLNKESEANEATKLGWLRGGSSGCITDSGLIIGSDPRTAVLRAEGIQEPVTFDDNLLFQAGHSNEDGVAELLTASGIPFKQEEECPIKWTVVSKGKSMPVSGRPDFIIGESNVSTFTPSYGIELKGIFSTGTVMEVAHFTAHTPKADNVCQSAHYSWQNNKLPWVLMYVNRGWHNVFYFGERRFTDDHRCIRRDTKTGKPVALGPFMTLYDLTWDGDVLLIDGKPSLITASGIERYYQYLTDCLNDGTIPKEHDSVDVFGGKIKKDKRKIYYGFKEADTSSYENWILDCKQIVETM